MGNRIMMPRVGTGAMSTIAPKVARAMIGSCKMAFMAMMTAAWVTVTSELTRESRSPKRRFPWYRIDSAIRCRARRTRRSTIIW
jgi:hypothetical protein